MIYDFPSSPSLGQTFSFGEKTWKWTGVQWAPVNTAKLNSAPVHFSANEPNYPTTGFLWYDTIKKKLKLWSGDFGWTDITNSVPSIPPPVLVSSSPPAVPEQGLLWFDTIHEELKIGVSTPGGIVWKLASPEEIESNLSVTVSASPPPDPISGALWYDTVENSLKIWLGTQYGSTSWLPLSFSPAEEKSPVLVSAASPANPLEGYLWYDTVNFLLKVWALGPQGGVWLSTSSEPGRAPPPVFLSSSEPQNPSNGTLWYDTIRNVLFLRDNEANPGTWISITNVLEDPVTCTKTTISSSPPVNPYPGDFWYDAENSNLNIWYVDLGGGQWISVVPYPQQMVTVDGGTFTGPILAGYTIPADPLAFVTVQWVQDYIAAHGTSVPITSLPDVDDTGLTNLSTLVYDSSTTFWRTNTTLPDITNGGTY